MSQRPCDLEVRDLSLDTASPTLRMYVPKAHGGIHSRTQRTTGRAARAEEKEKALEAAGVAIVPGPGEIGSTFQQVINNA